MTAPLPSIVEIPLESKLAFLRQPSSFPEPTYRVEVIETHMSWVFLTHRCAYKLKKPVCYDMLDFRAIEARHFYCKEEVRLNRRLAPTVYLCTVPLVINASGHLQLGQDGSVTDWLVKMRRLPGHQMLDYRIKCLSMRDEDAIQVAALLARFHRACPPITMDIGEYQQRLENDIARSMAVLGSPAYPMPAQRIDRLCARQRAVLQRLRDVLQRRVDSGKIVEGHGDLRPEHICLGPDLAIIDCIEFSRDLRILDAIDEIAFLALECERLGVPDFAAQLLSAYQVHSGDVPVPALIHFYQSYRACIRAKLAIWHLKEERFRYSAEWPRRALEYVQLAEQHIDAARRSPAS